MIKQQFAATHTPEQVVYRLTDQDVEDMIAGFLAAKCEPTNGKLSLHYVYDKRCSGDHFEIWRVVEL